MSCSIEEVVNDLSDFVHWLAYQKQSEATIMMSVDELVGELFEELVKGYQYYQAKDLTKPQLLAVLRRMMDNRISELVYKYFVTHRKDGVDYVPVDLLIDRCDPENGSESFGNGAGRAQGAAISIKTDVVIQAHLSAQQFDPETIQESRERVYQTMLRLSFEAQEVLKAVLLGNDLMQMNLQLSGDRAAFVYKNGGTVKLQPWHVADSLGMDEGTVVAAFQEIRQVYTEVCEEYE